MPVLGVIMDVQSLGNMDIGYFPCLYPVAPAMLALDVPMGAQCLGNMEVP